MYELIFPSDTDEPIIAAKYYLERHQGDMVKSIFTAYIDEYIVAAELTIASTE